MSSAPNNDGTPHYLFMASDKFPPFRVDVAVLFGKEMSLRGHRIDWLLQSEHPQARRRRLPWANGTAVVGASARGHGVFAKVLRHMQGGLLGLHAFRLARQGAYQFVQVKDQFIGGVLGLVAARLYGKAFVYWLSYPFPESQIFRARTGATRYPRWYLLRGTVFKLLLYRVILPRADLVFVQSEQMRRDVAAEGIPAARIVAVPMGVAPEVLERAAALRPPQELRPGPKLLYLGTMLRVRRIDFVIRVFARVIQAVPDAVLYMVGGSDDAEDMALLHREAERLGVHGRVVFTGNLPQAEAFRYVCGADVCLSPFYPTPILNSTSPTKLIEYLAHGRPVVANDHPEQRQVITESGGGLCVPYDEEAFAQAAITLLQDRQRSRVMGERGRRYVMEHRSYPTIAARVDEQYRRLLAGQPV